MGNGEALTAKHVCEGLDMKHTVLLDMKKGRYSVTRYRKAKQKDVDLCYLYLKKRTPDTPELPGAVVGWGIETIVGEDVYVGGFSGGEHYSFRSGRGYANEMTIIANDPFAWLTGNFIILHLEWCHVPAQGGISGSGAFNKDGLLIGIVAAAGPDAGMGIVPPLQVQEFLRAVGYSGSQPTQ
jgi:hypothetical protein